MKRALVLSGGGAKGAFQYGALSYILEHQTGGLPPGKYFNIISGVSVGALNGVMLAQNQFETLSGLWSVVSREDVYTGNLTLFRIFWRLLTRKMGILSAKPLRKMITRHVSLEKIDASCDYSFGTVSLDSGKYYALHARDFDKDEEFSKGVLASASMPVIWPPVGSIKTRNGRVFKQLIDGGIRNVSPLGDVIDSNPDEVVIINCNSEEFQPYANPAKNMLKIARRALTEITLNEIFLQDVRAFLHINNIISQLPPNVVVKKPDGTSYKKYHSILIEPDHDLGDALDFDREKINRHLQEGYLAAQRVYEKPLSEPPPLIKTKRE